MRGTPSHFIGWQVWRYTGAAAELNGSPSLSLDTVYVGSNDRHLHALDAASGKLKFKFETCASSKPHEVCMRHGHIHA